MLTTKMGSSSPVRAKLLVDMIVDGDAREKNEIVELSARDFKYLEQCGKVELAPAKK